jgi:hypothetical protein
MRNFAGVAILRFLHGENKLGEKSCAKFAIIPDRALPGFFDSGSPDNSEDADDRSPELLIAVSFERSAPLGDFALDFRK